jgi:hypothetical protein
MVLMPFSICRLPVGTTRLEFVTSGRSVAISDAAVGHSPARASAGATAIKASVKVAPDKVQGKISRNGTRVILGWWISGDHYHRLPAFIPGAVMPDR